MREKKQANRVEPVLNAATGYTAVALGIVCFLLALAVIMAGVRLVVGAGLASNTATTSNNATTTVTANRTS